ncbi:hypothetical protein [Alloyangia pacifica]|uniref:RNase NYN domain-containing protein n=1 Tax=Alloyangia pacifica TaxID=311180 RepID=A0A1I6WK44_9RHOB|nr:hypothetical protein [Alloyangia pacifica]SDI86193.1 hypothetical protein SAMN04488245_12842 [Alloyangia pacifica]SFT26337.1 hypothetical protein SAMN04488050_1257 [Alloyangia pacifica]
MGAETSELVATGRLADANSAQLRAAHTHPDVVSEQIAAQVTEPQGEEGASRVGLAVGDPDRAHPRVESPSQEASESSLNDLEATPQAWRRDLAIVDGMDVMGWEGRVANLEALRAVIDMLQARRVTPHIVLAHDACRTSLGEEGDLRGFRRLLDRDVNIDICPSEKSVAAWVIELAGELEAPIVSNNPYHAWPNARKVPRL